MTTARRTANTRSSRSSNRKIACHGFRSLAVTASPPTIALGRTVASWPAARAPDGDRHPERDGDDNEQAEPPLHPVDVGEYPFDLVRKEKGEAEGRRSEERRVGKEC